MQTSLVGTESSNPLPRKECIKTYTEIAKQSGLSFLLAGLLSACSLVINSLLRCSLPITSLL